MNVYLVSTPVVRVDEVSRFLSDEGVSADWMQFQTPGDFLPELAGRLCYMSFDRPRPGGNSAYLHNIKKIKHGSVLEHSTYGVLITGVSRSLTHELVRYRAGFAFSQLSQRYVVHAERVEPPLIATIRAWAEEVGDEVWLARLDEWDSKDKAALREYVARVTPLAEWLSENRPDLVGTDAKKAARQTARACLQNQTETKIMVTANLRAWRHFLAERGSPHADAEIRQLAVAIFRTLLPLAPNVLGDITEGPDTTLVVHYPKV